jgi:phytanoyl-CoA hydroxylase
MGMSSSGVGLASGSRAAELAGTGFIVIEDVLDHDRDLAPMMAEFDEILDRLIARLLAAGEIGSDYAGLPFGLRLIAATKDAGRDLVQSFDISLPLTGVHDDTPINTGRACFDLLVNDRMLDVAEDLIGGEIAVSPVGHIRLKLPAGTLPAGKAGAKSSKSPWHQDNGVVLSEADESEVLTVWVALNDSTTSNGCMQVVATPRSAPLQEHCPSPLVGAHIPDRCIPADQMIDLPMTAGSILVMHPRTVHGSRENTTADQVRISMDLRYQPVGTPTGRPVFPSFVARSRANPGAELHDATEWARIWDETRHALARQEAAPFNRWDPNSALCA